MTNEQQNEIISYLESVTDLDKIVKVYKDSIVVWDFNFKSFCFKLSTIAKVFELAGMPESGHLMVNSTRTIYQFCFENNSLIGNLDRLRRDISELEQNG